MKDTPLPFVVWAKTQSGFLFLFIESLNAFFNSNKYKYTYTDDAVRNESFLKTIKYKEINDPLNNWRVLIKHTPNIFIRKGIEVIARKLGLKKKFPKIYIF